MTLGELVERLGGKLAHGSTDQVIGGVNSTVLAGPDDLVFAQDSASATDALTSNAGAVALRPGLVDEYPPDKVVVETPQPRLWFSKAATTLSPVPPPKNIMPTAVVGRNVELEENISIGECAVVEDTAAIGARTRIDAGAVIGKACGSGGIVISIRVPCSIRAPRSAIGLWCMRAQCWERTGSGMCAIPRPGHTRNSRSRARW